MLFLPFRIFSALHNDILYKLALTFVPNIGSKTAHTLMEHYGTAQNIFKAPLKEIKNIESMGEIKAKGFRDENVMARAHDELEYINKHSIQLLFSDDEKYPARLRECIDGPFLLYYKGAADLNTAKTVAIVGTRKNTDYGQRVTEELVEGLSAQEGLTIISGLAHGIDTITHKKALACNIPTVGVMGTGMDKTYPASNKKLANDMVHDGGGILTEFNHGTIPEKGLFPRRNRVVAGMSDITIVVESDITGGALITARMASGYNREVGAIPGRVNDTRSAGCNELIRTNVAALINNADDVLELMNWNKGKRTPAVQKQLFINLSVEEQKVINLLQTKDFVHADELFYHTGLANSQLAATLLGLEMQGIIKALPGKNYRMN